MNLLLHNVASFLILLVPIFLITGPLLSDLAIVLIDLIFLFYILKNKEFNFINNFYFKLLILFNIYISTRSIFTDEIFFSLKSSLTYFRFTILIFAIYYFLSKNEKLIKYFSKVFLLVIILVCLDALFQYIVGFNILGFTNDNADKINGLFGDEAILGSYLIRFFPLFVSIFIFNFGLKKNKYFFLISLILVSLLIFLSGSRSSFFLLILFILFIFLFLAEIRKELIIVLFLSIISFTVLTQISSKVKRSFYLSIINPIATILNIEHLPINTTEQLNQLNINNVVDDILSVCCKKVWSLSKKKTYIFSPVYDAHYRTAFNMFKKNQIFGIGTKMYRKLCSKPEYVVNEFSCTTHPHNFYMQVLAENGLIGFLFIIIIFFHLSTILLKEVYYRNIKKVKDLNDPTIIIISGIFLNLWPIVPSGNLFNNWLSIVIYLPVGFYYFFKNNLNERN